MTTTVNNFLTGDETDNGVTDRLVELVKLIKDNKDAIDAFTATGGAITELQTAVQTLQGKAHSHSNSSVLNGLSTNSETGNLVFNNVELNGSTGVALVSSEDQTPVYNGQIVFMLTSVEIETEIADPEPDPDDEEEEGEEQPGGENG